MTDKQRAHSRLYGRYDRSHKIDDILKSQKGDVELFRLTPLIAELSDAPRPSSYDSIKAATCKSDAVILGLVTSKSSQINEGRSFIFTDYEVQVQEVLKDNRLAPISAGTQLTVTRPGGAVTLNGRGIRAVDSSFQLLHTGQRYVLFVKFIPATQSYRWVDGGESFQIDNSKLVDLREGRSDSIAAEHDVWSLSTEVRSAAAGPCKGDKAGHR